MVKSTKLARKMELKKKIEEEYRLAAERMKVTRVNRYQEYWDREEEDKEVFLEDKTRPHVEGKDKETEEILEKEQQKHEKKNKGNIFEEDMLNGKEETNKILIKETMNQFMTGAKTEEIRPKEEKDIKTELEPQKIRKERQRKKNGGKKQETERKINENKELKEVKKLQEEEQFRLNQKVIISKDEQEETNHEEKEIEETRKTEERIRELEVSIATLDDKLERFDIERMKDKTKNVVKRMTTAMGDANKLEIKDVLKVKIVNRFMKNRILWGTYLATEV